MIAAACGIQTIPQASSIASAPTASDAPSTIVPTPAATPVPTRPSNPYGVVDAKSLDRKLLFGYQGFFHAAGDGSAFGEYWQEWSADREKPPSEDTVVVDNWPDLSEFDADELFPTRLRYADGRAAPVYSSFKRKTTIRHLRWMGEYGLDGILLQRFPTSPWDPRDLAFREAVTRHVREGCETYGRIFAIEYDIGSMRRRPRDVQRLGPQDIVAELKEDWQYLVDVVHVLESDRYVRHAGRPVLGIWGMGLPGRPGTADEAKQIVSWFTRDAPERYRVVLVGGVMTDWRVNPGPQKDPAWLDVFRSYDVIQPWLVGAGWPPGRYAVTDADVEALRRNVIDNDVAETRRMGKGFMPVVYPGISWSNRTRNGQLLPFEKPQPLDAFNAVPRRGGRFWWRQLFEYMSAGCTMIKCGMYDEIAEGTAMFKVAATARDAPAAPKFVTLDADGVPLTSDWYLRVAGAGTRMLRGEIPLTAELPISPR